MKTLKLSDEFIFKSMEKLVSNLRIEIGQKDSYIKELEYTISTSDTPASSRICAIDYDRFKELQKEEYISEILDRNEKLKIKIKEYKQEILFLKNEIDILLSKIKKCE